MNPKRVAILVALTVAVTFAAAHMAKAQPGKTGDRGAKKILNLTDQQKADAKLIFEAKRDKVKAVCDNNSLTQEQKKAQLKDIRQTAMAEFKQILTPEQQAKFDAKVKNGKKQFRGNYKAGIKKAKAELNLTADQDAKIKQIVTTRKDEVKALKENNTLTSEQKKAEFKKIHQAVQGEIRQVLTPDQKKKFDEMVTKAKARFGKCPK